MLRIEIDDQPRPSSKTIFSRWFNLNYDKSSQRQLHQFTNEKNIFTGNVNNLSELEKKILSPYRYADLTLIKTKRHFFLLLNTVLLQPLFHLHLIKLSLFVTKQCWLLVFFKTAVNKRMVWCQLKHIIIFILPLERNIFVVENDELL